MDLDAVSVHKHAKKELGQYPAILTSRLVNNPYILARNIYRVCLVAATIIRVTNLNSGQLIFCNFTFFFSRVLLARHTILFIFCLGGVQSGMGCV